MKTELADERELSREEIIESRVKTMRRRERRTFDIRMLFVVVLVIIGLVGCSYLLFVP